MRAAMDEHLDTPGTSLPGGVAFQSPQPPDADQILQRCREEVHYLYYTTNDTRILADFTLCEDCNITNEELEILELSGVCRPYDFSYMPLIYYMYASIFVIALFGNLLVLYTVVTSRKMHTVTNFFIANLAVGDLLIMVFCVPFSVASIIVLQYWPFGEGLCIFVNYCQVRPNKGIPQASQNLSLLGLLTKIKVFSKYSSKGGLQALSSVPLS